MQFQFFKKKYDSFDFSALRICKSCDNTFSGKFCNICGEKVIEPNDKSFYSFLGSILNEFTFLDNKFLYTLRLMLLKTGFVTRQFIEGTRIKFVKPLSMFFVVNVIYFLFSTVDTFNSQLTTQINYLPHSPIAKNMVEKRLEKEKITLDAFEPRYNEHSTDIAKLLHIVFVVLMAIPIMLVNFSKKRYFVDHLTTSLEFNIVTILMVIIVIPWIIVLLDSSFTSSTHVIASVLNDNVYSFVAACIYGFLFYTIERRVYSQRIVWAIVKSIILLPCTFFVLQIYRALLFFVTMWTL
jgi:hypothetical protein